MMLLFQVNYTLPFLIGAAVILSVATAVAAFLVTRTIYRTTLPSRLADTYKANYEAERARADLAEKERNELREQKRVWEAERSSLTLDYSQLSQLYARKSVILDAITGIYTNLANIAEAGRLEEFLAATANPVQLTRLKGHGGGGDPQTTDNPHTTKG